jgi:hypothetical protein
MEKAIGREVGLLSTIRKRPKDEGRRRGRFEYDDQDLVAIRSPAALQVQLIDGSQDIPSSTRLINIVRADDTF